MEKTSVMREFENICAVPRYSFHNEKIIAYCIEWAKENGFSYYYDDKNGNVVITREAAPGNEDRPPLVLQGHLDMVAETAPGFDHNWDEDGIDFYIEDDYYRAKGTTLGADDAVAAAIGFALFKEKDLNNPHLELLLTTDEEVGMLSVRNADLRLLKGRYLLNIDSGPEGSFTIGCSGGKLLKAIVADNRETLEGYCYEIEIGGLKGGHSGISITMERANALKMLGEVLYRLSLRGDIRLSDVKAEGKDNAISNNAICRFISKMPPDKVKGIIGEAQETFRRIFRKSDPDIFIRANETEPFDVLKAGESHALRFLLHNLPYGVMNFEQTLDTVETSVNLGLVEKDMKGYGIYVSIRSSVAERSAEVAGRVRSLCEICGAVCEDQDKDYPAWPADHDSPFLKSVTEIYREMYGKEPKVSTTHGGLECGYILANSNIEGVVAIGPDSIGEHTTDECLSVSSLNRTYEFVKKVVENI